MVFKIFNTLEKIASADERIIQAHNTMEKAAVTATGGLRALLKTRKAYIASAMRRNPKLTQQQARNEFYKRYGLQAGEGGKISAVEGANLGKRTLEMQQKWLSAMKGNKQLSRSRFLANNLLNNNWWKYGLAGAGGVLLGRTTAPSPQPMPAMMPPQSMPAMMVPQSMMYNGL